MFNAVITAMHSYENVQVDWRASLYGHENLWPALFETLPPLPDGPCETITGYQDDWLTYKRAGLLYQGKVPERLDWRSRCNRHWQRIKPLPRVIGFVNWFVEEYFHKTPVIAAIVRAHGHAGEQLTGRSQSLDEYAAAIE